MDDETDIVRENIEAVIEEITTHGVSDLGKGDLIWLRQILEERGAHAVKDSDHG